MEPRFTPRLWGKGWALGGSSPAPEASCTPAAALLRPPGNSLTGPTAVGLAPFTGGESESAQRPPSTPCRIHGGLPCLTELTFRGQKRWCQLEAAACGRQDNLVFLVLVLLSLFKKSS